MILIVYLRKYTAYLGCWLELILTKLIGYLESMVLIIYTKNALELRYGIVSARVRFLCNKLTADPLTV